MHAAILRLISKALYNKPIGKRNVFQRLKVLGISPSYTKKLLASNRAKQSFATFRCTLCLMHENMHNADWHAVPEQLYGYDYTTRGKVGRRRFPEMLVGMVLRSI